MRVDIVPGLPYVDVFPLNALNSLFGQNAFEQRIIVTVTLLAVKEEFPISLVS
ncbi:hypothetical protein D3C84_330890 [compost metagenome]